MTVVGGQSGILQGERRWFPLAHGLPRHGPAAPGRDAAAALAAHRDGGCSACSWASWCPAVGRLVGAAHGRRPAAPSGTGDHSGSEVLREVGSNSHALLAFFALSNVDVILARNVLDEHEAGLYAGGLILVKAVLFLPQFVVVLAFPSMSTAGERRRR